MNTAVNTTKTLQQRVGDRIKEQIGDLVTADDLKGLVDAAMKEAFFTKTLLNPNRSYHEQDKWGDSFAVKHVKELLEPQVREACKEWLAANPDVLRQHLDDAIGNGISKMVLAWLDGKVQGDLYQFGQGLRNTLQLR